MADLISRQAAIYAPEIFIKDCNPEHFVGHEKFIEYMDDVQIGSFGNWQFANGFNMGLTAAEAAIMKLPSIPYHRKLKTFKKLIKRMNEMPSAQLEWNNHTVACLLAELFDDTCACNYNGIDEWLPGKCELLYSCPNPVGVSCWEQYLKHRAERRTDEESD